MSIKDIKLHYNRNWQASTDVHVYTYRYEDLLRDIRLYFLPLLVPSALCFRITCPIDDVDLEIVNDVNLTSALCLGGEEINFYVDVKAKNPGEGSSADHNSTLGYFVEEVHDEAEIMLLDSKGERVEGDEISALSNRDDLVEEDEACTNYGVNVQSDGGEVRIGEVEDITYEERVGDVEVSDCVLSTDSESEFLGDVGDNESDSFVSLEDEGMEMEVSDDSFSDVESDGEGVDHFIDDLEIEVQLQQLNKVNAGNWFKREGDGRIILWAGQLFKDVYHFREMMKEYVIQERFEIVRVKNEKSRVTAICKGEDCPWRVHASSTGDGKTYKIKTYTEAHTCLKVTKFREATYSWISSKLHDKFAAEPNKSRRGIEQDLKDMYGISGVKPMKLFRARLKARTRIEGDHKEQYAKAKLYGNLVLAHNSGSLFVVTPYERQTFIQPPVFRRLFVMIDGIRRGFMEGCRPFICVDGCHLKGPYGGMFLSAVAVDGNNRILPLVVCIAESENKDSWFYFFNLLKEAIGEDCRGTS